MWDGCSSWFVASPSVASLARGCLSVATVFGGLQLGSSFSPVQEENHARAELERRKQEQRLRERNRRQREIAEERRLRELKKKVRIDVIP